MREGASRAARLSWEEFVRLEEASPVKHDFLDGVVHAMAGGSGRHNRLVDRIFASLGAQLRGRRPCEPYSANTMVRAPAVNKGFYPDVTVVCGEFEQDPTVEIETALNPTVLVEVLSDRTESYDRDEKRLAYMTIPTVREVVLVDQVVPRAEVWRRKSAADPWTYEPYQGDVTVPLRSIGCALDLRELYASLPRARPR